MKLAVPHERVKAYQAYCTLPQAGEGNKISSGLNTTFDIKPLVYWICEQNKFIQKSGLFPQTSCFSPSPACGRG